MIACDMLMSAPPPMPCKARAAMSWPMVWASAQNADDAMKTQMPISSIMRRP